CGCSIEDRREVALEILTRFSVLCSCAGRATLISHQSLQISVVLGAIVALNGCTNGLATRHRQHFNVTSPQSSAVSASVSTTTDCSVSPYEDTADAVLLNDGSALDEMARSGDVATYSGFAYVMDGATTMYEATKDASYIAKALGWAEAMIATATVTDPAGYKNWPGGWASPYLSTPIAYQLDDLIVGQVLARVARDIL